MANETIISRHQSTEEKYRDLFEKMDQGFCVIKILYDDNGSAIDYKFQEVNSIFEQQTGLRNAKGKTAKQLVPDLEDKWIQHYASVAKTGESTTLIDGSDAMKRWFEVSSYSVGETGSNEVAVLFKDITESRSNEQLIKETKERLELINKATHDTIWDWDLLTNEVKWNDEIEVMFGYQKNEVEPTGEWWIEHIHPDHRERVTHDIHEVIEAGGNGWSDEYPFLCKDGSYKIIFDRGFIIHDESGKSIRMIGSMLDITQRKQYEVDLERLVAERTEELKSQNSLLDNILVNSSNGISVTEMVRDENGKVIDAKTIMANESAIKFTGMSREVYLSTTAVMLDPNILQSDYGRLCMQVLETGTPGLIQYYLEFTGRWLELTISKMDDDHLIHIFTDVTPIKEANLRLEKTVEELQQSNQNLEEFAYAASHDLKEPIRKIHFFSERLKSSLADRLSESEQRFFDRMEYAAKKMGVLIEDLLSYSKISIRPAEMEDVELNDLFNQAIEDLDLEIEMKAAKISVSSLFAIRGYPSQLLQAFQNLLSNSLKYIKAGESPVITVKGEFVNGASLPQQHLLNRQYYRIAIRDNGIGFEQAEAERIFNVFTRLHGNSEFRGTGVGLSIVRKVVENHDGVIKALGEPGKGAEFQIYLPASLIKKK